jgi:1-acyl-sn-glycerol-3-phosphate acyltransferase
MIIVLVILGVLLLVVLANIKIVPQAHQYVIEFLGKYEKTWDAGLHIKIPFFEKIAKKITLKELSLSQMGLLPHCIKNLLCGTHNSEFPAFIGQSTLEINRIRLLHGTIS